MHVTVVTILESGQHLSYHHVVDSDSIAAATEGPIADHINDRMAHYEVKRFVVIAGDLTWSVSPELGQHHLYERKAS